MLPPPPLADSAAYTAAQLVAGWTLNSTHATCTPQTARKQVLVHRTAGTMHAAGFAQLLAAAVPPLLEDFQCFRPFPPVWRRRRSTAIARARVRSEHGPLATSGSAARRRAWKAMCPHPAAGPRAPSRPAAADPAAAPQQPPATGKHIRLHTGRQCTHRTATA